jgi:hypothetical protein
VISAAFRGTLSFFGADLRHLLLAGGDRGREGAMRDAGWDHEKEAIARGWITEEQRASLEQLWNH